MRLATLSRIARTIAETLKGDEAFVAAEDLRMRIVAGIKRNKSLDTYGLVNPAPARIDEANDVDIQLTFRKAISPWYVSELLFELKDGALHGYAKTLHVRDGRGLHSTDVVVARNGGLCEEMHSWCVEDLAKKAAQAALDQRVALLSDLGFAVEPSVLKRFVRAGNAASAPFMLA